MNSAVEHLRAADEAANAQDLARIASELETARGLIQAVVATASDDQEKLQLLKLKQLTDQTKKTVDEQRQIVEDTKAKAAAQAKEAIASLQKQVEPYRAVAPQ